MAIALATPALADEGWVIQRFASDITIQNDASLRIVEAIDVDFGAQQRHGIFRNIPVRYRWDDTHLRVYRLEVRSVTDAAEKPIRFALSDAGADKVIKIGDPDRTVSGRQTYRITYDVSGAMNAFGDHDELFWNVNGGSWDVRAQAVTATVHAPAALQRVTCYQGPAGSDEACRATTTASGAEFAATRPFPPRGQLTIVAAVAKGVVTGPRQLHLSYVHTPMRYAWELRDEYLRAAGLDRGLRGWAARFVLERLRHWDVRSARGVDVFLANSAHVAQRIRKAYRRDAEVLYPPVDVDAFPMREAKEDFYLTVSRLEPYKRIDLLVDAFAARRERRLIIIGGGPEMQRLRSKATPNVELLGRLPTPAVRDHMQRARAFLFAGIEDFGIVMAEAQACGTPVIALARGGAAEIVRDDTGLLFSEQTAAALGDAVQRFEEDRGRFAAAACRENALRFDGRRFRERFAELVRAHWERFAMQSAPCS